jgi:hypothetical protein
MITMLNDTGKPVLHLVARKLGNPPIYYYRQWNTLTWTAWNKINLDILSDHVLPVIWNQRLYLFWATINKKADKAQTIQSGSDAVTSKKSPSEVSTHLEVQLAWSEFKGKKWLAKQTAPQTIVIQEKIEPYQVVLRSTIVDPLLHIDLFTKPDPRSAPQHYAGFVLGGVGNAVEAFLHNIDGIVNQVGPDTRNIGVFNQWDLGSLYLPYASDIDAMAIVPLSSQPSPTDPARQRIDGLYIWAGYPNNWDVLLACADYYRLLVPHQFKNFDSSLPFFYEDSRRSYFVSPDATHIWFTFTPFYHAFAPLFVQQLNLKDGLNKLYSRQLQLFPDQVQNIPKFDAAAFQQYYLPEPDVVNYPSEGVDFDLNAGYSIYNWELFFHAPFQIAESLSLNQRFKEAKRWYEFIFNPTTNATEPSLDISLPDLSPTRCFWVTKPFYMMEKQDYYNQSIQQLMNLINSNDQQTVDKVEVWRNDPFNPHAIAQLRPVAYQRTIVMKYIDNLIAWGDQLFSQDTMESVNQATQLYVLASELLGPRPEMIKPLAVSPDKSYADLEEGLDAFSNASVLAVENLLGPLQEPADIDYHTTTSSASGSTATGSLPVDPGTSKLPSFNTLYFSITPNEQLAGYWDTVADRLFKIRHGLTIEGVLHQPALFAPPINPALLVKATAAGLDLSSILNDMSAALPPYRFRIMIREAIELCEMVRGFGNELLGALEKKDAETLALLRSGFEKKIQDQISAVLQVRIDEAAQEIAVIAGQRNVIVERQTFYSQRKDELTNTREAAALLLNKQSMAKDEQAQKLQELAYLLEIFPNVQFGASGAGGSPHVTAVWGTSNLAASASAAASALRFESSIMQMTASMSQVTSSYQRRKEDWGLQYNLAADELAANDSQAIAAQIRQDIAQKELDHHMTNIQMASDIDDFMHSKYTNQDLYEWMISQISVTYFQAYQLAYTVAKRAEICFQRELGMSDTAYIQFGYWDSLKKGLLAGDRLLYDLQRLKSAYYAQNARELELTKHISLLSIDPFALVKLRSTGKCTIQLPEILFDLDNPGHYMRRVKSVGITMPCVAGPYSSVPITLTLQENSVRINPSCHTYDYSTTSQNDPTLFMKDSGGANAIVTSSAQNDRGLFELRFEDDRYLPFECAGAISTWDIKLNPLFPQFDYKTISDVILHLQYTARDGGDSLRDKANQAVTAEIYSAALDLSHKGLYRFVSMRQEFGTAWYKFLNPGSGQDQKLILDFAPDRFPFFTNGLDITITSIDFIAKLPGNYALFVTPPGASSFLTPSKYTAGQDPIILQADPALNGLHTFNLFQTSDPALSPIDLGTVNAPKPSLTWTIQIRKAGLQDFRSLTASEIDDLMLVIQYQLKNPV